MKNQVTKYTAKIGTTTYEFTAHSTKAGARASIHEAHNPCLVQLSDGRYDAFPLGHPLPCGAVIIERLRVTVHGPRWQKITHNSMADYDNMPYEHDYRRGPSYPD